MANDDDPDAVIAEPWVNETLGTTTAIITHNAVIRQLAHRTFYFADGAIVRSEINDRRLKPVDLEW